MILEMMRAKIHRARVTDANLNYVGSITLGRELLKASGLLEFEKVDIVNVNNGERFSTYIIAGDKTGEVCLNGAAARKVAVGDVVIIISYAQVEAPQAQSWQPRIVQVGEKNEILSVTGGENV